jgi:tetratricopeptide (TPR) repeat protein
MIHSQGGARVVALAAVSLATVLGGLACSSAKRAPATAADGTPATLASARRLRYFLVPDLVISADRGVTVPPALEQELRDWIRRSLVRANLFLVADAGQPHDAQLRMSANLRGSALIMHGSATLQVLGDGALVEDVTSGDAMHARSSFAEGVSRSVVEAFARSRRIAAFADARVAAAAARAQTSGASPPPGPAAIAPPAVPSGALVSPDAKLAAARDHSQQGAAYYDVNRFQEAYAAFEASYLLHQDPALLYNMAQCQRKLGNSEEALRLFKTYLRNAPTGPFRGDAEKWVRQLEGSKKAVQTGR